nr:MAG TPA: Head Tail Connector Protein [Caudoviricetes sp.]
MNAEEELIVLKQDLQLLTASNDEYLGTLLDLSAQAIQTEGIRLIENDLECDMAVIQYAAYLFRKRAAPDTTMPRFLRWQLNNLLMSQKGAVNDV